MVQRSRGRGDTVPHAPELLRLMGECRKRLIDASTEVRPFGTGYHAIHLVTTAIDSLAHFMTGRPYHFEVGGSVPPRVAVALRASACSQGALQQQRRSRDMRASAARSSLGSLQLG